MQKHYGSVGELNPLMVTFGKFYIIPHNPEPTNLTKSLVDVTSVRQVRLTEFSWRRLQSWFVTRHIYRIFISQAQSKWNKFIYIWLLWLQLSLASLWLVLVLQTQSGTPTRKENDVIDQERSFLSSLLLELRHEERSMECLGMITRWVS